LPELEEFDCMSTHCHRRTGFTLVELLVVIGIIGALVALLMPAVQSARESARRMSCGNKMKQISLAIHNYHDTHRVFPCNANALDNLRGRPSNGFSWIAKGLPFLEQQSLHDRLDFRRSLIAGAADDPATNWGVIQTPVSVLLCPSDPTPPVRSDLASTWPWPAVIGRFAPMSQGGPAAVTTYMGNMGFDFDSDPPQGPCERSAARSVGFRDVLDGTSNVFLLMERSPSWSPWCAWASSNGTWATTAYPINLARKISPTPDGTEVGGLKYASLSLHPGGIHVAMVDGSIHFVSENIEKTLYIQLGHMADGFPLGGFQP
jgi:prepilin-type N-terminal cleavage/methylation domain-containing protein